MTHRIDPSGLYRPSAATYKAAIERTIRVIARRARVFRNLIVAVVALGIATLLWSVIARSFAATVGLLFLIPICGAFLLVDARLVGEWRSETVRSWVNLELDLAAYGDAIRANPAAPHETLDAMLRTLPATGTLAHEQLLRVPTRRGIAAHAEFVERDHVTTLLLNLVVSVVATAALAAAILLREWTPLGGLGVLALRPVAGTWIRRRLRMARDEKVAAARSQPGFDAAELERVTQARPGDPG